MQSVSNNEMGTLFLNGEIFLNNSLLQPYFMKVETDSMEPTNLKLQILPNNMVVEEGGIESEIFYSEPLLHHDQYTSITIFSGNELLAHIDEIEVLW